MRRVLPDERGSALVIALAFLMLFSLILVATLSAADGGLRLSSATRNAPRVLYGADGAIEQAIQELRYDGERGVHGSTTTCSTNATLNGRAFYVSCDPFPGSGHADSVGSGPALGIISMSDGGSGEFGYQQSGNSVVRIDGGVYSRTKLKFDNGTDCATDSNNCQQLNLCPDNATQITATTEDGQYTLDAPGAKFVDKPSPGKTDVGAPISGPGVPGGTVIASVDDDVNGENGTRVTMSKRATLTGTRAVTFREDYPLLARHCQPDPTAHPDAHGKLVALGVGNTDPAVPTCDPTRYVAIEPTCPGVADLIGNDPGHPPRLATIPNGPSSLGCGTGRVVTIEPGRYTNLTALNALTTSCDKLIWFRPGVYYFEFAGTTPVWTIAGPNLRNQVIVGGASTWDTTRGEQGVFLASVSNGGTTVTTSSAIFTPDDKDKYISSGYSLPYGTRITSVVSSTRATISAPASSNVNQGPFTISATAALCDRRPNTTHNGVQFIFGGASRLEAVDSKTELCSAAGATLAGDDSGVNDDARQVVFYGAKPLQLGFTQQNGCATQQPYPASGCATLKTTGPKTMFIVHGSFYAPSGVLDLQLQTVGYQVISRGIIARVISLRILPSADNEDPVIYSPDFAQVLGADRHVLLRACEGNSCAADGSNERLRAVVRFKDTPPGSTTISPGYSVKIESWTVRR